MTESTSSALTQQNGESQPPFLIKANYDFKIDEYILFQEKKEEIPVSLKTIMRLERPKSDGEFIMV
jgi:flagellar assembly factor FliW